MPDNQSGVDFQGPSFMKLFFLSLFVFASAVLAQAALGVSSGLPPDPPAPMQTHSIAPPSGGYSVPAPQVPLRDYSILAPDERPEFHFDVHRKPRRGAAAAAKFESALELFQGGNYSGAAAAARKVYRNYSGAAWGGRGLFLTARAYGAEGNLDKAAEYFKMSKRKLPALSGYADFLLAERLRRAGDYHDALRLYLGAADKARAISADCILQAGDICLLLGRYTEAAELMGRLPIKRISGGNAARADYIMAVSLAGSGNSRQAVKYYGILWREYPGLSFGPKAEKRLRAFGINIKRFNAADYARRAASFMRWGIYDEALKTCRIAYRLKEKSGFRSEVLLDEGECCFRLKDDVGSIKAALSALAGDIPDYRASEAYLLLARVYLREGDTARLSAAVNRCFRKYPQEPDSAEALYLLGTALSEKGDYDGALDALGRLVNAFPRWPRMDEALWQAGWAHYKKQDYASAQESFRALYSGYPNSSLAPQALYWRSKALGLEGDKKNASRLIGQLEASYPYSFYGLISSQPSRIFSDNPEQGGLPGPQDIDDGPDTPPAAPDPRLAAAYELGLQGLDSLALKELRRDEALFKIPEEADKLTDAYHFIGEYRRPLELLASAYAKSFHAGKADIPPEVLRALFPLPYWDAVYLEAKGYGLDPWLISAVIREESHCSPDAVSSVGAVGLMQLMNGTADIVCRNMNVDEPEKGDLKNYCFNIPIGSYYIRQLLKKHNGRLAYVLAEYNAGAVALARWTSAGNMPDDFFIENIDYPETRGYVKKVLRDYFIYKELYSGQSAGK